MSSASFVAQLLLGVEAAFADLADELGSAGAPLGLLDQLGWTVADGTDIAPVRTQFAALSSALVRLAGAAQSLSALPEDASLEDFVPVMAEMTAVIADTVIAARALAQVQPGAMPAPFSGPELWASLAAEAIDLLLIRYLDRRQRLISGVLRVLGVIVEEPRPAGSGRSAYVRKKMDWSALGRAFSKPGDIMPAVYGWGGTFKADLLLRNLSSLFAGFGLSPSRLPARAPLVDLYYSSANPARNSATQLSVPVYWEPSATDPSSGVLAVDLQLAVLPIPPAANRAGAPSGLVVFPSVRGAASVSFAVTESTDLIIEGGFQAALVRLDIYPGSASINILPLAATFSGSALLTSEPEEPWILLGTKASSRVELDGAHAKLGVKGTSNDFEAIIEAGLDGARVVIQLDESDGFLASVLGTEPQIIPFSIAASWSSKSGFRFEGQIGLDVTLPLHLSVAGVFTIDALYITLGAATSGTARMVVAAAAGVKLGPLTAAIDRMGIALDVVPRASGQPPGNLGSADLQFGFKPPAGVGLSIKAGPVTGGGYIFFDPENEQYSGVLQLSFKAINLVAIGLLTTRLPDAAGPPGATKKGFSLLLIIAVDFPPIQLGFGFSLNGVGGLLGVNRTMLVEPLRAGVKNRTVDSILFPKDPVARATQIISDLRSIFPPAEGRFVFGPMVKIGWGPNSIIEFEAALVLELMAPIRLVILGRIQAALPDKKDAVLKIRLDIVGVIDFDRSEASVDASLVDSRLTVFALTGDMAMRVGWGATKNFILAAGGFNRRFQPPAGFPALDRLGIALADSDNPRLRLSSYLAITPNTIQFGAEIDIYAQVDTCIGVFSISVLASFDAMIQFQPFEFFADIYAAIDIARNGTPFFHAALSASFSGPNPWHAIGYAEFDFFGRHRIEVEATVGKAIAPPEVRIGVDELAAELLKAIGRTDTWTALPPADGSKLVSLRDAITAGTIAVHPLGTLTVRQRVLPLGKVLTRFGAAVVDAASFDIARVGIGINAARTVPRSDDVTQDDFAPGQFEALTDDQKLARPAFESMRSGTNVHVVATGLPADAAAGIELNIEYEEAIVDVEPATGSRKRRAVAGVKRAKGARSIPATVIAQLAKAGAGAHAATGASGADAFAGAKRAIGVRGERYVAAGADSLVAAAGSPTGGMSCAEAHDRVPKKRAAADPIQVAMLHEAA